MIRSLPVPPVSLAPWPPESIEHWTHKVTRLRDVGASAGHSTRFNEQYAAARALLERGDMAGVVDRIGDRRFARAVTSVWLADPELCARSMTPGLVTALGSVAHSVSRLTTITLASLLLTHFDLLDTWHPGLRATLSEALRISVGAQRTSPVLDVVEAVRRLGSYLLEPDGPRRLARHLLESQTDLHAWMRAHGLAAHTNTRYAAAARDAFYIVQIEATDPVGGDHTFLAAISNDVVARYRSDERARYFGHEVLSALTSHAVLRPSAAWLTAVTAFAGDPRHTQTRAWQTWWEPIDDELRRRAERWMSGVDLRAFLDGIEDYAVSTDNDDMVRMLERRARFLDGLFEQDRVHNVRLILGPDISRYIRRAAQLSSVDTLSLTGTGIADTAVIYVDCGDFWLVEGTHNFSLHIYTRRPVPKLADPYRRSFSVTDLRTAIPARHGDDGYARFSHHTSGSWVHSALAFLRSEGISLDERALVSRADYVDLLNRRARDRY